MQKIIQNTWFESTLGQHLVTLEQEKYDVAVGDIFGFHAVQVGLPHINCLKNSRIPSVFYTAGDDANLRCESEYLPFAENSIDLLCLPHALEFSDNPHQVLREAARILVPEGHLMLTGFNPLSIWGVRSLLTNQHVYPWYGQFFSLSRIKDWLALLGLEFVEAQFCCYEPPINNEKWLKRFVFLDEVGKNWWPVIGGQYFIVAKKRVVNITLLKPSWRKKVLKSGLVVSGHKNTKSLQKKPKKRIQKVKTKAYE